MVKVYIDDMLVKSKIASDHVTHVADTFNILRTYSMKLNPVKCAFGMPLENSMDSWSTNEA